MIDWGYWSEKARKFSADGKYGEAIECYEKILEDNPRDSFALTMIGSCFSDSGQFDQALIYVNRALDIKPWDSFLWYNKAMVYYKHNNYIDAIEYFDKAISFNNNDATSWYFKGWCYYYLMDISKAIDCFEMSYNIDHDESTMDFINELKLTYPHIRVSNSSGSGRKQCPNCGRFVNEIAISCGYCGYSFTGGSGITKTCPNCGTALRKNKKVCPKCNYNFKKSKVDLPEVNRPKKHKPKVNKPINIKHFDNGVVSFDFPDNYSRDYNSKYEKLDITASFKIGSHYDLESAFAIFDGEPISNEIPDSKFKEIIKKSLDSDVLNIDRHSAGEKERIIIKAQNKTNGNIEYHCCIPETGFSILFVIPEGNEYLFDEKWVLTVTDSLEKSTGELISKKEVKTCPNCGAENSDDSNFCIECGVKLDVAKDVNFCIHCGTEIIPGAKFCMNCGKLIED